VDKTVDTVVWIFGSMFYHSYFTIAYNKDYKYNGINEGEWRKEMEVGAEGVSDLFIT